MEYIKIVNWKRWQTWRSDRGQPPWIKLHRVLLRNPEWNSLSDGEKGQLVCMWILAADKGGKIPADPHVIATLCYLDELPDLERFQNLGFISGWRQGGVNLAPSGRPEESRVEKSRVEPPKPPTGGVNGFQEFWLAYPRKIGKGAARRSWKRIRPSAELQQQILNSLSQHTYSHDWTREYGRYIPHPATFLNQERWDDELVDPPDPSVASGEFGSSESRDEYNEALNRRLSDEAEKGSELAAKRREAEDEEE